MQKSLTKAAAITLLLSVATPTFSIAECRRTNANTIVCARPEKVVATPEGNKKGLGKNVPRPEVSPQPVSSPKIVLSSPDLDAAKALLGACDVALSNCETLLKDKDAIIHKQDEIIGAQGKELTSLREDRDSILKSPIFWTVVGIALGGIVVGVTK